MAVREIVFADNPILRKKSKKVKNFGEALQVLLDVMVETMQAANGAGLAAPQINIHKRVALVRLNSRNEDGQEPDPPIALINPEIIEARNEERDFDGCLSFPGLFAQTVRPHYLRVTGLDERGKPFDRVFEGFDAVLVHHEIDHLEGMLFIDRLESVDDLYRVKEDEEGNFVRVPVVAAKE